MESLLPVLEARGANSVRVTSLLEKRTELSSGFKGHYVGFSIPDKFVVGYCLDFNEFFRCGREGGDGRFAACFWAWFKVDRIFRSFGGR